MFKNCVFTSESVSEGHPDKICDRISDEIVDLYLSYDHNARVAVESLVTYNKVVIAGEISSKAIIANEDIEIRVRNAIKDIGYEQKYFHWKKVPIDINVHNQSSDIAIGVDEYDHHAQGAGDQGIMFGYACNETEHLMPAALFYSHKILETLSNDRKKGILPGFMPDSKSQISLLYSNGKPIQASSIVVSTQHEEHMNQNDIKKIVYEYLVKILPNNWMCNYEKLYINPTGRFVIGGPEADTGVTGRKIIVDTYGGAAPHGGGAFSGKDPTKVDRSASYMARYLAKNIVASGIANECTIQISYAIGIARPISFFINLHNANTQKSKVISDFILNNIDLSPKGIVNYLKLNKPIYARTSAYGHFGKLPNDDGGFSWENIDLAKEIRSLI